VGESLLETHNLTKSFGGVTAINDLSLSIRAKSLVGLIGPNGAGKTTFINLVTGIFRGKGKILFRGERIDRLRPHEISLKGIGRTFQIPRIFSRMTCLENVIVPGLGFCKDRKDLAQKADKLLKMLLLDRLRDEYASSLSGGQKKLLEVARVLMLNPELILLDEPFHGVHPELKDAISQNLILLNKEQRKSFLIVSHDIPEIMKLCERIIVLNAGVLIADGPPEAIRNDQEVIEAYMGI